MLVNPAVFDNVGVPLKLVFGKVGTTFKKKNGDIINMLYI